MVRKILTLGHPALYRPAEPVGAGELPAMRGVAEDLLDTLMDYREKHGAGRGIAAPQIGVPKRMIYLNLNGEHTYMLNPVLQFLSDEAAEVMDDCMSFPGLYVKVQRYRHCVVRYKNLDFLDREVLLKDDLAELVQHEYDHLDGILATQRAVDSRAFFYGQEHAPRRGGANG